MNRWTVCLFVLAQAAGAQSPRDFAYGVPISISGDEPFFKVELPAAVFEGAVRPDAGDLRIFNGDGAIVPFAYMPEPRPERERRPPVELVAFPLRAEGPDAQLNGMTVAISRSPSGTTFNLTTRDGNAVTGDQLVGYVLDASAMREPMAALTLNWIAPPRGFTTRVRIEGSDDLALWQTLVAGAPLLDLEYGGRHLTRNRIELPATQAKYLRISWPAGQPALELASARVEYAERVVDVPRQWVEAEGVLSADKPGEYEFDLRGTFPVDRIALDLPELNSVAPAQVFARIAKEDVWRPIGSTVFYRLRQVDGELSSPAIRVGGGKLRYLKLSIDPDAHFIEGFNDIRYGVLAAQKAMVTKEQNLSSMGLQAFEAYLENRRVLKRIK